jgi:hypothetical protein
MGTVPRVAPPNPLQSHAAQFDESGEIFMGREMKFALITGGSMVFGAIVFAMVTHARNQALPPLPAPAQSVSQELDSLSRVTQAPANPPVPDYTPTWISPDEPESTGIKQGGEATLSTDETSNDSKPAPPDREKPRPNRVDASAAYTPPSATDPAPSSAPAPPSDTPQQTVNSTPSNNTELREMLRKGK